MKRTSDVTILGTVVYGVSISTTTFTLRSRTSLGSTQMNNQSKASKSDRYWVMTSEKRSPTYVVYHFDTQRLSPTRVCKKYIYIYIQWRSKVPKSVGAHRHVIYVPSVKNQYKRVVIGYMVIYKQPSVSVYCNCPQDN